MLVIAFVAVDLNSAFKRNRLQIDIVRSTLISDLKAEYGTNIIVLDAPDRIEISFTYGKNKEVYIFTEKDYHKLYEP